MKTLAALFIFVSTIAYAQQNSTAAVPPVVKPPDTSKAMQKIVVTGSYIRRTVDEDSPSPVTQIDATKAQESGSYSVGAMLNDNAVTASGGANISFHGQSSANNLVLLNGMRLPKIAGSDSVDISFIPASAIERAEVLKDGASALYGSEALAGVVNIITKKEYDGANVFLRYSSPQKNLKQETNFVGTYGKKFGRTNFLGVFQYNRSESLFYRDTEFGMKNVKQNGSLSSDFPNIIDNPGPTGTKYTSANCPADRLTTKGECKYNYYDSLQFDPQRNNYNLLLTTGTDFNSGWRLESAVIYTLATSKASNTPPITEFEDYSNSGGQNFAIPKTTADSWAPLLKDKNGVTPGSFTGPVKLQYSPDDEIGIRRTDSKVNTGIAQVKVTKESSDLDWEFSMGYGLTQTDSTMAQGNANKQILFDKLNDLSANGWKPFNPQGQKGDVSSALIESWRRTSSSIVNPKTVVSGKAFQLGSQGVFAAAGLEGQWQNYKSSNDPLSNQGLTLVGPSAPGEGQRNVGSAFLEFTYNPISNLQLQLAGRYDRYSDFGTTLNPKLAAAYKFSEILMGRISYGTGFKAPDLTSLFQGRVSSPQRFRDAVACGHDKNSSNCSNLFATTSFGNPSLDAEKGQHYNVGLQIRPHKKVQITFDHWRASGTQALQDISLSDLTVAEKTFGKSILDQLGVTINRNNDADESIQSVLYPVKVNSGKYHVYGIDFDVAYKTQIHSATLGTLNIALKTEHSHVLANVRQDYSFAPMRRNFNFTWKNVMSVNVAKGNHMTSYRMRSFAAADKDTTLGDGIGVGSIPMYQEHDLHYEYFGLGKGVLTFGIRNIFDRKVFTEYNRGKDGFLLPGNITALGRAFYLSYSQDF